MKRTPDKPIAYTIAGSDSSGGAGIQADLATFANFGVHGCSVITALTAQNRQGVHSVAATPASHLRLEFQSLLSDLPPAAIKIGMLANGELVETVALLLREMSSNGLSVPVVLDPVLRASAGGLLLDDSGCNALADLLPYLTLITPNIEETAQLTGEVIRDYGDMERAALRLLDMGVESVLITGGHMDRGSRYSHDYFISSAALDSPTAFWLRGERISTRNSHGTGCTLSSAIAAALALGYEMADAIVLGKMTVTQGLRAASDIAGGKGPVTHPGWPSGVQNLPAILPSRPDLYRAPLFARCDTDSLGLYPVVDSVEWVERLLAEGVKTIQLRIKGMAESPLRQTIQSAVQLQQRYDARLFINDHWQLAVDCGAYGVHLGQEDIGSADFEAIAGAGLRLGVSNHAWHEFARAHALNPSYMAIGPIYHTTTKKMRFAPQGLAQLQQWVDLLKPRYPLTAIGGIDQCRAAEVAATGVSSLAVVRAITESDDYRSAVKILSGAIAQSVLVQETA